MKQSVTTNPTGGAPQGPKAPEWQGFTIEELRYQRAINMVRMQIMRERLTVNAERLENRIPLLSKGSMLRRAASSLSIGQYAMMGITVARQAYRIYRFLHRR